jgi:hypothetical protein
LANISRIGMAEKDKSKKRIFLEVLKLIVIGVVIVSSSALILVSI